MNLAIKPNRRELVKALVNRHYQNILNAAQAKKDEWHRLNKEAQAANDKVQEIARTYGNGKYTALQKKLAKIVNAEFPEAQVYFTLDMEPDHTKNLRFKADGKATVRLVVLGAEQKDFDLPEEVRAAMLEAEAEAVKLREAGSVAYYESQKLERQANSHKTSDNRAWQDMLDKVTLSLGGEASPHLDALAALVEKTLTPPAEEQKDATN